MSLAAALSEVLPAEALSDDPTELQLHAHDFWPRSLIRRRAGQELAGPGVVASPASTTEVVALLRWCHDQRVPIVPFGAGTGVCGGATAVAGGVTLDLKRMNRVLALDTQSGTVTVQPGIIGQALEDHLAARGWTLGHVPSSIHCSTIGGLLAVRSAGQLSSFYGKLEDMVVGLEAVLADGSVVRRRAVPGSAAGPDLARLFLGGEGTTGVITEATLRIWPRPAVVVDRGVRFPDLASGVAAARAVMRTRLRPAVFRLYDEADTALVTDGAHDGGCLAIVSTEGEADIAAFCMDRFLAACSAAGGEDLGAGPGERWRAHRHDLSYRLAEFLRPGGSLGDAVFVDTMEVATVWAGVLDLYAQVRTALQDHCDLVLAHLSHLYPEGASLYFTFGGAASDDDEALRRYDGAWVAGQRAALAAGATGTHHHGVGLLRAPWLAEELGPGGADVLRRIKGALDPAGILNPGKLGL